MNILFSCAGRRAYLLKYFRAALDEIGGGKIFATDMSPFAPALAFADVALRVPSVYAGNYLDELEKICRENAIDALFSLNDLELPILASARERFAAAGTRLVVSAPKVIEICFDKMKTARFVESLGLNSPKTFTNLDEALAMLNRGALAFPLILKPRWGSGSIGRTRRNVRIRPQENRTFDFGEGVGGCGRNFNPGGNSRCGIRPGRDERFAREPYCRFRKT